MTAIRLSEIKSNQVLKCNWICKCSCGNTIEVRTELLISGQKKSCGCLKKDRQYDTIRNEVFGAHCGGAKNRGIGNFLSKEEYLSIASLNCHYCGRIDSKHNRTTGASIDINGIDRKNNEPFYNLENSLPCCWSCNWMKMDMPYIDFIKKIRQISEYTKDINSDPTDKKESDR